jgi:hypothetical protein
MVSALDQRCEFSLYSKRNTFPPLATFVSSLPTARWNQTKKIPITESRDKIIWFKDLCILPANIGG